MLVPIILVAAMTCGAKEPGDANPTQREATFDPAKDEFIAFADPWVCWRSRELVESTRMHVAQSFVVRYYVQKVGDASGRLACERRETRRQTRGTIFPDGTVLLITDTRWIWAKPDEIPVAVEDTIRGEQYEVLAVYPDGAVMQPVKWGTDKERISPVYWIPFKDRLFDNKSRRVLVGDDGMVTYSGVRVVRRGSTLIWIDDTRVSDSMPADKRRPPRLFEFDVATGVVRQRQFSKEQIPQQARVLAFDAKYVYTGYEFISELIDRSTGLVREIPTRFREVRDGFVYNTAETKTAIELTRAPLDKPSDVKVLHRFTDQTVLRTRRLWRNNESMNGLVLFGEQALYVWKGARWVKITDFKP
jgi:hypothetical protein